MTSDALEVSRLALHGKDPVGGHSTTIVVSKTEDGTYRLCVPTESRCVTLRAEAMVELVRWADPHAPTAVLRALTDAMAGLRKLHNGFAPAPVPAPRSG